MEKIKNQLRVSVSNSGFVDEGDGVVSFPKGLTITDSTEMRSGARYDIKSLDISKYEGQLTADHHDSLGTLIGKTIGVKKTGNRVTVDAIQYAVNQNPYARLAYDLLVGGFSNSFSIETLGPWPDPQDPVYRDHELVGLSQVVVPNNYNAKINQFNEIVHNSLERSQQNGLDITGLEEKFLSNVKLVKSEAIEEESMTKEEKNASEEKETPVIETAENEAVVETTEVVETEAPVEEAQEESEEQTEDEANAEETEVENNASTEESSSDDAQEEAPKADGEQTEDEADDTDETEVVDAEADETEEDSEEVVENQTNKNEEKLEMTKEEIAEIVAQSVAAALKPVQEEIAQAKEVAQNAFDAAAKEPEFEQVDEQVANAYDSMSEEELFAKQLNAAVAAERLQSVEGRKTLDEINARNLQALKDAKIVNAALTLEDLGNFVIGPELYNQVVGVRTNYSALLDATQWRETNSLEFSWLTRSSDIDMTNVAVGFDGDVSSPDTSNNRLKPVSSPSYGANTGKMEEMAAVTPISINVIKFAAADILMDVAEGYRNDYDRKRAQLVIARLQQAVNATSEKHTYDISNGIIKFAQVVAELSDVTTIGKLIMNSKTLAMIKGAAIDANQESLLLEIGQGSILGTPFLVVPNDLLPTLNTTETKTFAVLGSNVTIDQAVFYADLSTFTGRSSGGLKYDVDGSASYEISGTVYSAYQRNEIVLRGSFFRGGVVKDTSLVASIPAVAVS